MFMLVEKTQSAFTLLSLIIACIIFNVFCAPTAHLDSNNSNIPVINIRPRTSESVFPFFTPLNYPKLFAASASVSASDYNVSLNNDFE